MTGKRPKGFVELDPGGPGTGFDLIGACEHVPRCDYFASKDERKLERVLFLDFFHSEDFE